MNETHLDANQKGGASFVRKTTKYWVQSEDVSQGEDA